MIVLALFLLAVAILLVVVVVMEGGSEVAVDVFEVGIDTPLWGIFLAGVVAGMIALGGLMTLVAGVRRSRERRREIEYLRRKVAQHERAAEHDVPEDESPRDWIDQSAVPGRGEAAASPGGMWTPETASNASSGHRTHS